MLTHPSGLFSGDYISAPRDAGPQIFTRPTSPISSRTWGAGWPHVGLCPIFLVVFVLMIGSGVWTMQTWDRQLERRAISLTSSCFLQSRAQMPVGGKYARGFTGYTRGPGVTGEIEKVYFKGANSSIYWQVRNFAVFIF